MRGVTAGNRTCVESRAGRGPEGPGAAAAGAEAHSIFCIKGAAGSAASPPLRVDLVLIPDCFPTPPSPALRLPMFPDPGTGPGGPGASASRSGGWGQGPARGACEVSPRSARADLW